LTIKGRGLKHERAAATGGDAEAVRGGRWSSGMHDREGM
jgi:hypothetical protein